MRETFNVLLPVATLLLGAGLANLLKFSELRNASRLEAADQLAELPQKMRARGSDSGLTDFEVALDRVAIRLSLAGVPEKLVNRLGIAARYMWDSAREIDTSWGQEWLFDEDAEGTFDMISIFVAMQLSTGSRFRRWRLARNTIRAFDALAVDAQEQAEGE